MDSRRSSIPRSSPRAARRGFTLVELIVAASLGGVVLAAVLGASLQLLRSGVRVSAYAEMNIQARRALEQLAVDMKAASDLTWHSATDISVTVEKSDGTSSVYTYAWNSGTNQLIRVPGTSSSSQTGQLTLASGISSLAFSRLTTSGTEATTDSATKRVQVVLTLRRSGGATGASSRVATTFTLRNKPAS